MRYSVKRTLNIDRTLVKCEICGRECKGKRSYKSHKTQTHSGPKDTTHRGKPIGTPAWNKGLRTKPDNKNPEYVGRIGGYRANAGRSKKFVVYDSFGNRTTLQSTYELAVFEILCELGIEWVRPKALRYDNRNYFADFYLPTYNVWLDPKNAYKAKQDADKIQKVMKQNDIKVFVLLQHQISKEYIASLVK